jgi:hypothetical protein
MASGFLRGSLYNAYLDKQTLSLRVFEDCANQIPLSQPDALAHPSIEDALCDFLDFTFTSRVTRHSLAEAAPVRRAALLRAGQHRQPQPLPKRPSRSPATSACATPAVGAENAVTPCGLHLLV